MMHFWKKNVMKSKVQRSAPTDMYSGLIKLSLFSKYGKL